MIKEVETVEHVKQRINGFSGERVRVKVELGRNKSEKFTGILSGIYPSLFTVEPDDKGYLGKTSYSYAEVLCGSGKLKKING